MALIVFIILAALCVGAVGAMILTRNQAHSALFLVVAFASLGGIFGLLDAPFAAAVQVLVYAGAIMVLFLFAIMMFNLRQQEPGGRKVRAVLGGALAFVLLVELGLSAWRALSGPASLLGGATAGDIARLGRLLFEDYLYPFEITSVLILAALVGAIALAGRTERE